MTCINETDKAGAIRPNGDGKTNVAASLNTTSYISRGRHKERIIDDDAHLLILNGSHTLLSNKLDTNGLESNA
jgi:hypothetical protein